MTRILAIDHGERRIGLAIGETESGFAFSRPAMRRRGDERDTVALAELARAEGADEILVGLPRNMDGSEGQQASRARAFGARIAGMGFAVSYADERLTTWQATERLRERGDRPDRRSGEIDSAAAMLLLQEYLDTHPSTPAEPEETA